jgi:hypothetical protein
MIYAAIMLFGMMVGLITGYLMGRADYSKAPQRKPEDNTILVKRSRTSLRSPLQTNRLSYEEYKLKDSGLYDVVRPKGRNNTDKVEVGR